MFKSNICNGKLCLTGAINPDTDVLISLTSILDLEVVMEPPNSDRNMAFLVASLPGLEKYSHRTTIN